MLQDAQRGKVVFYLLESGKCRFPIRSYGAVVVCSGRFRDSWAASCIEEGLRHLGSDRPDAARPVEHVGDRRSLKPSRCAKGQRGIECSAGYAYLVVGLCNATFPGSDVGSALEEICRQSNRDVGK